MTVPSPYDSEASVRRFWHRDIPSLEQRSLWAELEVTEAELARRIVVGSSPRIVYAGGDIIVDDIGWLEWRVRSLRAEQDRRRRPHAA